MSLVYDLLKVNGGSVWSVTPDTSVERAINLMAEKQVEALPVLELGNLIGIVSEKDTLTKVISKGRSTDDTQVREIMTTKPFTISPVDTVEEGLNVMIEKQLRHLPVMAEASLLGCVSMMDLLNKVISDQKDYIYRLENYVMGIGFN